MGGNSVAGQIGLGVPHTCVIRPLQVSAEKPVSVQDILLLFPDDKIIVLLCLSVHIEICAIGGMYLS